MRRISLITLLVSMLGFLPACNDNLSSNTGRLSIQLTDAPFPTDLVAEANITIDKIEVRKAGSEDEGSTFITLSEEVMSFNLLDLTNGVTAGLIDMEIEAGTYDLVRLYVSETNLVLSDGSTHDLKVPSGAQTGIKVFLNPAIEVAGGLSEDLLLDFDVSQSYVLKGSLDTPAGVKGFNFKPTIKAANISTSGRLKGMVTDSLGDAIDGATISVFAADTLNTSSLTDSTGYYAILGLLPGSYDVKFEYDTLPAIEKSDIYIVAGNATTVDAQFE